MRLDARDYRECQGMLRGIFSTRKVPCDEWADLAQDAWEGLASMGKRGRLRTRDGLRPILAAICHQTVNAHYRTIRRAVPEIPTADFPPGARPVQLMSGSLVTDTPHALADRPGAKALEQRAKKMLRDGHPQRMIAVELGISKSAIARIAKGGR